MWSLLIATVRVCRRLSLTPPSPLMPSQTPLSRPFMRMELPDLENLRRLPLNLAPPPLKRVTFFPFPLGDRRRPPSLMMQVCRL